MDIKLFIRREEVGGAAAQQGWMGSELNSSTSETHGRQVGVIGV